MSIFSTEVLEIGNEAFDMLEAGFFILFGEKVPAELKDYCYIIKINEIFGEIKPGQKIILGDQQIGISAVGEEVMSNLENLGHVTIKFDGSKSAELPGTIYVEKIENFNLEIGDTIQII
ncbi:PTS glucitol/sorbitol transporter subunit IIA [Enterococcus sp. RIT-PI-f]|uniref:PTS glucitol/sorbitol transporter subunit IIA n=1 Tax=Enterococcus sp. RIT-PI-f TaxID=1690244 RepID=UPI0006B98021|nr:PTS glucitol/sorbitol transporter subunit IIA [Enterococcus sp. RIT-PI-f]KPG68484.1 hypothetical protein AEQ18_14555 [Enterococcus sp. RIT-PI-f]